VKPKAKINKPKPELTLEEQSELLHFKAKSRSLEQSVSSLLKDRGKQIALFSDLKAAIPAIDPYPREPIAAKKHASAPIAAVVKISDWQIGEVIDPAQTESFGAFNFGLAEKRVLRLARKLVDWVTMHRRAGYEVSELHVFSEADMVSGNIHYELEVTNEFPAPIAAIKAGYLFAEFVARLAPHFPKVKLWEVNADNHGRFTRKNQWKQGAQNNWTRIAHEIANGRLLTHQNVEAIMSEGPKLLANVLGKKYLLCHGHHIMSTFGIPYYGMSRDKAREALKRMNTDQTFDYMSMGHFHVEGIVERMILVNGNLPGTTEMDAALGRHGPPVQVSFMSHPKHGLFNWTPWNLSEGEAN
jgi:hypothetical protein